MQGAWSLTWHAVSRRHDKLLQVCSQAFVGWHSADVEAILQALKLSEKFICLICHSNVDDHEVVFRARYARRSVASKLPSTQSMCAEEGMLFASNCVSAGQIE